MTEHFFVNDNTICTIMRYYLLNAMRALKKYKESGYNGAYYHLMDSYLYECGGVIRYANAMGTITLKEYNKIHNYIFLIRYKAAE